MDTQSVQDVIDGATPLECKFLNVRPRLFLTAERLTELRRSLDREPYAGMLNRMRTQADAAEEKKGGMFLPHLALSYLLTDDRRFLERVVRILHSVLLPDQHNLYCGRILHNVAVTYDWLYADLNEETRQHVRQTIEPTAHKLYHKLGLNTRFPAQSLTQNHFSPALLGFTSAAAALYGDVPGMAPMLRCAVEKTRNTVAALGDDGASAEGHAYGQAYDGYLVSTLILIRDLAGVNLFPGSGYLKSIPLFYIYSSTPRNHWRIEIGPRPDCMMIFCDGVRYNWYGPDAHLYALASIYRNPCAQWLAGELVEQGASADSSLLPLLCYDETVPSTPPDPLPLWHHFQDKDIVLMRTGWDGEESVCGFICGPAQGHHALENYTGELCGGHMNPNAGSFQLFAFGEHMISGDGYFFKRTEYQNTLLVNGIGQSGDNSEWFDSLAQRREKKSARILRAESVGGMDVVIGDATAAYRPEAGLKRFLRHLYRLSASCWIVVDEIEARVPSTFEILFHSDLEWQASDLTHIWSSSGERGAMRLSVLMPDPVEATSEMQPMQYTDGNVTRTYPLLRIRNQIKGDRVMFLTVLETHAAGSALPPLPFLSGETNAPELTLQTDGETRRYKILLNKETSATPILFPAIVPSV